MICPKLIELNEEMKKINDNYRENPEIYSKSYCETSNYGEGCKHKETCISYKKELQLKMKIIEE